MRVVIPFVWRSVKDRMMGGDNAMSYRIDGQDESR